MGNRSTRLKRMERMEKTGIVVLTDLKLQKIPEEIWKASDKVKSLSLENNKLESLLPLMGTLVNLKILNLSCNKISLVPIELSALQSLATLDLSNNKLQRLPMAIVLLPSLTSLNLKDNQITSLNPEEESHPPLPAGTLTNEPYASNCFQSATKLKFLDLSNNKLTSLPPWFGDLPALEEIGLDGNQITQLPESVAGWKSLKIIRVKHNLLDRFPSKIFTETPVSAIYIERNPIKVDDLRKLEGYDEFEKRRKGRVDQLLNV